MRPHGFDGFDGFDMLGPKIFFGFDGSKSVYSKIWILRNCGFWPASLFLI